MAATNVKVTFLTMTENATALIYAAYRQCYKAGFVGDNWDTFINGDRDAQIKFIQTMLDTPHESPLEHVSMSFAIAGVSRTLSHQLVRHRIASYSQQSQRYVAANGFEYIIPPHIMAIPEARHRFEVAMDEAAAAYSDIQRMLDSAGHEKTANEDARFVLPNACETKIVVTMNIRSLYHFFGLRCCQRCYDSETEVLTNNGWKFFKDVEETDLFYSMNPETKCTELVSAVEFMEYNKKGDMIRVKSQGIDQLVTPNHKFLVSNSIEKTHRTFALKKAEDVIHDKNVIMKKNTRPIIGKKVDSIWIPDSESSEGRKFKSGRYVDAKLFMRFLGFYLSDGWTSASKDHRTVGVCKGSLELAKKYQAILQCLTPNTVSLRKDNESYKVEVHDWNLYNFFKPLGKAHDKHVPEFVWEYDHSLIKEMVLGLLDGDFSKKSKQYWTVSKRLADDVQRAFFHIGDSGTITVLSPIIGKFSEGVSSTGRKFKIKSRPSTTYVVSLNQCKNEPIIKRADRNPFSYEYYEGVVYCVRLEKNHTLYVRRNGKPCWSGNSQWEIRKMAFMMLSHCKEKLPALFQHAGAYCDIHGYCPELPKYTCGRVPTKEYLLETAAAYEDLTK